MAVQKILVIVPAWVGDVIMSQVLLSALKHKYGVDTVIDVLANSWVANIIRRMPQVNNIELSDFQHGQLGLAKRFKLGRKLKKNNYTQVYVLPNSFKSALVAYFAGIPLRVGFVGEFRYLCLNQLYRLDKKALPRLVDRYFALANDGQLGHDIEYPQLSINLSNRQQLIDQLSLSLNAEVICFCPAAEYGPSKRYPTTHFAELANLVSQAGYQVWVLGSAKDCALGEEIIQLSSSRMISNLCGKTNLADTVDLFSLAKAVITNDSGLMHIACAVGAKVVALYGSSSPEYTPPLSNDTVILRTGIWCSPCFARACRFGHYDCLKQLMPQTVFAALNQLVS